jgi:hypothetical protein
MSSGYEYKYFNLYRLHASGFLTQSLLLESKSFAFIPIYHIYVIFLMVKFQCHRSRSFLKLPATVPLSINRKKFCLDTDTISRTKWNIYSSVNTLGKDLTWLHLNFWFEFDFFYLTYSCKVWKWTTLCLELIKRKNYSWNLTQQISSFAAHFSSKLFWI